MKRLLIAAAAFTALAGAAAAQQAYTPDQGSPPSEYPRCTHRDQDRCIQPRAWRATHMKARHHAMKGRHHKAEAKSGHDTADGERG